MDFYNDAVQTPYKGALAVNMTYGTAATSSQSYGYWAGGRVSYSPITTVQRLDYSDDAVTLLVKGPLATATYQGIGVGNKDFGYISSGYAPGSTSTIINRIDYSDDTATALAKGPLEKMAVMISGSYFVKYCF